MEQKDYIQKKKHLTADERSKIELLLKQKKKPSEIARELGRDRSVITREIKRNSVTQIDSSRKQYTKYFADAANRQYKERRAGTGCKYKLVEAVELINYVEEKVKNEKWSPDAAIGRAKIDNPEWVSLSTKTYYNYIDLGLVNVKPIDLVLKVRLNNKKRTVAKRKKLLGRSIEERPESVDSRQELGHWEMDTVVGKREKSSVLLTLTERKTRLEFIIKIASKASEDVTKALTELKAQLGNQFEGLFHSITCDNGSEFSDSKKMENELGVLVYYAHPYSSFERGTNENHNGIIRRFIPKGKQIDDVPDDVILRVQEFMNNLPRKQFGYLTPLEYMVTIHAS